MLKYPTKEVLSNFSSKNNFNLIESTCLDISKNLILLGSEDGTVTLYDIASKKVKYYIL